MNLKDSSDDSNFEELLEKYKRIQKELEHLEVEEEGEALSTDAVCDNNCADGESPKVCDISSPKKIDTSVVEVQKADQVNILFLFYCLE